jgi:azurin/glucose/arabinose dehydrogenase
MKCLPMSRFLIFLLLGVIACPCATQAAAPKTLEIREGDHICLIGNTLAERMQFPGHNHWETLLYQRFPKHNLVVRNLAWSADEVALRPRAEGFGTPDEHLAFSKADVVIAFFGFNESFKGEAGLPHFKKDLEEWIKHTQAQNYSGKGAPRIALVSPIAAEDLRDPNLPTGKAVEEMNSRLEMYTAAMKELAEKNEVVFADVFHISGRFRNSEEILAGVRAPLTINGIHQTLWGDAHVAPLLDWHLFGKHPTSEFPVVIPRPLGSENYPLHKAIEDKNQYWYNRYRIVDSYYVYGGRSGLKFADGEQTNRDVMERERQVLDVMVANRDKRIWDLAQGKTVPEKVDDSNVPPFLNVQTWFGQGLKKDAGKNTGQTSKTAEGASADILPVAEVKKTFTMAKGFAIDCFASEEDFPELANATMFAFDTRGRLWVCTMPSYPQWRPGDEFQDKIVILEDSDGDGKANYCTTFADKLHLPISFEFFNGGILLSDQRNLTFLKDTDGDDKADVREVMLSGFDSADSHHVINAFTTGPGGDLYFQEGTFHHTQVETPYGPVRCMNAGTYRYEPRSQRLEVFVSYNYANPHGIAFDKWGQTFIADASGGMNYFATAFSGHLPYPDKHSAMRTFLPKRVRPTSGCEFIYSRHFPDEMQGNFLLNNCIGVQGTLNHTVKAVGSGYEGTEIEPLMLSSYPNFRPVDMEFGPDAALYIVDWAEALIGHMQYSLRDPLRDKKHGRIWRITNTQKPLLTPAKIAGEPIDKLLNLLREPEMRTRDRAKKELETRDTKEVLTALNAWLAAQTDTHAKLEALWLQQWLRVVDPELLAQLLKAKEHEARAAAVRVVCNHTRHEDPKTALSHIEAAANDAHPLVRLEAVRACSFFGEDPELAGVPNHGEGRQQAINIALQVLKQPMDYYLTYTLGETMRALKPTPADIDIKANPAALGYVLDKMTNDELKTAPREEPVLAALLERVGIDMATRDAAAGELAQKRKTTREAELIEAVFRIDERNQDSPALADLGKLLAASPAEALKKAEERISRMGSKDHGVRSARIAGMAAWVALRGSPEPIWRERQDNHETLAVLCDAAELISDPALRAKYQPLLVEVLQIPNIPAHLRKAALRALPLTGADNASMNFAILSDALFKGQERQTAANALMQLPRSAWDKTKARPLAGSILAWAKTVPDKQRTEKAYVEVAQFGMEIASLTPGGEDLRKQLRSLGVAVFVVKTVREQMRYDTPQLTVEAGKPFEVIFENTDIMPHNIVFIPPGKRADVGNAAQLMPATPDRKGNLYIPENQGIWAHSKMLEPGQTERLQLRAPKQPGNYEYVCTFPGHWLIMWGTLKVE